MTPLDKHRAALLGLPPLQPHEGSWIVTSPQGNRYEVFRPLTALRAKRAGYQVQSILDHLGNLNAAMRNGGAVT